MRSHEKFAGDDIRKAPLAWLRENSRYLLPTGTGDAFYAAAMAVRNWIALHYVIGTLLFTVFAAMLLARSAAPEPSQWAPAPVAQGWQKFTAVPAAARLVEQQGPGARR